MSMAEDIENLYVEDYDDCDESIFKEYLLGTLYWKTKSGAKIKVQDMEDSHLRNCLSTNSLRNKENWDIVFRYELNKRMISEFL